MKKRLSLKELITFFALVFLIFGCSSIHFNEVSPIAKDFKPTAAVILPAIKMPDGVDFDAERLAKIVYGELIELKKFDRVVEPKDAQAILSQNQELQNNLLNYITKLRTLNISDPELAKKIGEAFNADALFAVEAGKWGYNKILGEKTAEVNITIKMIDAKSGNIIWKASHGEQKEYSLFKPELVDMAKDVVHRIMKNYPNK